MSITFAIIKPNAYEYRNEIKEKIIAAGFEILKEKSLTLSRNVAEEIYKEHTGRSYFEYHIEFMVSGPVVALLLKKEKNDAISSWRDLIGPTGLEARKQVPDCLRYTYGDPENITKNAFHGSDDIDSVIRESMLVFGDNCNKRFSVFQV